MICYRDKTFCTYYRDCIHGNGCGCALTREIWDSAQDWWTNFMRDLKQHGKAPICQYAEKPDCHVQAVTP
jgi:hypothetical protein